MRDIFHVTTRGVKVPTPHWEKDEEVRTVEDFVGNYIKIGDNVLVVGLKNTAYAFGENHAISCVPRLRNIHKVDDIDEDNGYVSVDGIWIASLDVIKKDS